MADELYHIAGTSVLLQSQSETTKAVRSCVESVSVGC
jgi:hypothetical protein